MYPNFPQNTTHHPYYPQQTFYLHPQQSSDLFFPPQLPNSSETLPFFQTNTQGTNTPEPQPIQAGTGENTVDYEAFAFTNIVPQEATPSSSIAFLYLPAREVIAHRGKIHEVVQAGGSRLEITYWELQQHSMLVITGTPRQISNAVLAIDAVVSAQLDHNIEVPGPEINQRQGLAEHIESDDKDTVIENWGDDGTPETSQVTTSGDRNSTPGITVASNLAANEGDSFSVENQKKDGDETIMNDQNVRRVLMSDLESTHGAEKVRGKTDKLCDGSPHNAQNGDESSSDGSFENEGDSQCNSSEVQAAAIVSWRNNILPYQTVDSALLQPGRASQRKATRLPSPPPRPPNFRPALPPPQSVTPHPAVQAPLITAEEMEQEQIPDEAPGHGIIPSTPQETAQPILKPRNTRGRPPGRRGPPSASSYFPLPRGIYTVVSGPPCGQPTGRFAINVNSDTHRLLTSENRRPLSALSELTKATFTLMEPVASSAPPDRLSAKTQVSTIDGERDNECDGAITAHADVGETGDIARARVVICGPSEDVHVASDVLTEVMIFIGTRFSSMLAPQSCGQSGEVQNEESLPTLEVLSVEDAETGKIIGNQGSKIRRIEEHSGAFLQMTKTGTLQKGSRMRAVFVVGRRVAIEKAKEMICNTVRYMSTL